MPRYNGHKRRPTPRHRRRSDAMVDAGSEGRALEQRRKARKKWHAFHNRSRLELQAVAAEIAALTEQLAATHDRHARRRINQRLAHLTTPPDRPSTQ